MMDLIKEDGYPDYAEDIMREPSLKNDRALLEWMWENDYILSDESAFRKRAFSTTGDGPASNKRLRGDSTASLQSGPHSLPFL